jgi:membrane protease YdiL (CAAX protease family)
LRSRFGNAGAVLLSALFFAFIHADPGAFFPLFGLGLIFGYLYLRTGSLVPGALAHGLWNATSFFLVRLAVV